jgi:hypothetical protein
LNKKVLSGISIFSVFILCSIPYQSIVADTSIEEASKKIGTKLTHNKIDEFYGILYNLIELKLKSDNDCDCNYNNRPFLICFILSLLIVPLEYFLVFFVMPNELELIEDIIKIPLEILDDLYYAFRCFRPF